MFQDLADRLGPVAAQYVTAMRPDEKAPVAEASRAYSTMASWLMENRGMLLRKSYCVKHQSYCNLSTEGEAGTADMLKVHFAGTTCKGWSSVGQKRYFGDKSEEPHAIWLAHRRVEGEREDGCCEDLVISECTVRYPSEAQLQHVQRSIMPAQ